MILLQSMAEAFQSLHDQAAHDLPVIADLHGKAQTERHKTHGDITISTTMMKLKKSTNCQYCF